MDLFRAERNAKLLMAAHGLTGWRFEWDNAKRLLGQTKFTTKTISLSRILTPQLSEDSVRDTMLHEIAHALVGFDAGHGPVWRQTAISIGCNGKRCATEKTTVEYKWRGVCPNGHTFNRHRKSKGKQSCNACSPNGFSEYAVIRWSANY